MKINADTKITHLPGIAGNGSAERKPAPVGQGTATPEPSAKVMLSGAAQLAGAGAADSGIDAEKVARISAAIQDGSFKVNPEAIADKLIAHTRDLLSPRQH